MDWTFSTVEGADEVVSDVLDIYGYLLFCCPIFAAIPGLIFKSITKHTGSKLKGDMYGLIIIMIFTCVAGTIGSGQMCYQVNSVEDQTNAIAFALNLSMFKTIVYSTPTLVSNSLHCQIYKTLF